MSTLCVQLCSAISVCQHCTFSYAALSVYVHNVRSASHHYQCMSTMCVQLCITIIICQHCTFSYAALALYVNTVRSTMQHYGAYVNNVRSAMQHYQHMSTLYIQLWSTISVGQHCAFSYGALSASADTVCSAMQHSQHSSQAAPSEYAHIALSTLQHYQRIVYIVRYCIIIVYQYCTCSTISVIQYRIVILAALSAYVRTVLPALHHNQRKSILCCITSCAAPSMYANSVL